MKIAGDPNEAKDKCCSQNGSEDLVRNNSPIGINGAEEATVDFDAAVMAIEGAVTAAVEAAPKMVNPAP